MLHLWVLVVWLTVVLLLVVTLLTGRARGKYGIAAPAVSGHPLFERAYRVQMNTLEQTVLFLPALWLATQSGHASWAGVLGLVWLVGRVAYVPAYMRHPPSRHYPFMVAMIALLLLLILGAWGVARVCFGQA
ncbi:MAG TPA: MAPEG family protein [Rhodanobacteraceae bacterium]